MTIPTSSIFALLAVAATHAACSEPEFSHIERKDSGPPDLEDASATDDAEPASDATSDVLTCEPASATLCTPSACGPVCHAAQANVAVGAACTVYSATDPSRFDDCAPGNVCLGDGFGAFHCFGLCRTATDCPGGRACTPRGLAGGTSIRVCDPPYRNCSSVSEPCCNPLAKDGCGPGQFCYLIPPPAGTTDSWTVCEYVTGGGSSGQLCTTSRDCLQGLACFFAATAGAAGECRQVCDPTDPNACATGTCAPYLNQWGICPG